MYYVSQSQLLEASFWDTDIEIQSVGVNNTDLTWLKLWPAGDERAQQSCIKHTTGRMYSKRR